MRKLGERMELFRIRWQETWGDCFQGVLPKAVPGAEVEETIRALGQSRFPAGVIVVQDDDTPYVWRAEDALESHHAVWYFVEPVL